MTCLQLGVFFVGYNHPNLIEAMRRPENLVRFPALFNHILLFQFNQKIVHIVDLFVTCLVY